MDMLTMSICCLKIKEQVKQLCLKTVKRINGTWEKDKRTGRTIIRDASGNQIKFDRGLIWFEILPTEGVLTVK
jgi:hypothetical protein